MYVFQGFSSTLTNISILPDRWKVEVSAYVHIICVWVCVCVDHRRKYHIIDSTLSPCITITRSLDSTYISVSHWPGDVSQTHCIVTQKHTPIETYRHTLRLMIYDKRAVKIDRIEGHLMHSSKVHISSLSLSRLLFFTSGRSPLCFYPSHFNTTNNVFLCSFAGSFFPICSLVLPLFCLYQFLPRFSFVLYCHISSINVPLVCKE